MLRQQRLSEKTSLRDVLLGEKAERSLCIFWRFWTRNSNYVCYIFVFSIWPTKCECLGLQKS